LLNRSLVDAELQTDESGVMSFKVMWMRGPLTMGCEPFDDLGAASAYAGDRLAEMQGLYGATAVKIVDAAGTPHFLRSLSRT
jgi:hypothetical protein